MGNYMKRIKQILAACLFMGSVMALTPAYAADNVLPDLGDKTPQAIAAEALKKDETCTRCHDETETAPILNLYQTKHGVRGDARTPTCQSCHGESKNHLGGAKDGNGRPSPDFIFKKGVYSKSEEKARANQCLACHKGGNRSNWDGGQHENAGLACNDCHVVHRPKDKLLDRKTQTEICFGCHKDQRADTKKISHHPIQEGKVVCSDCHNPHGSTGPTLLKKNTVNETCWQCHAEKRGPFLFEHQPAVESCTNCHTPHGSAITPLLKSRAPFLCQECHDGPHQSPTAFGPNTAGAAGGFNGTPNANYQGRACLNCHVQVHGSNSPAGGYLQR
jgi:DmsE family decaheme c-type cytochrome